MLTHVVGQARRFLEDGQELAPLSFVGNLARELMVTIPMATNTVGAKEESAAHVRQAALAMDADYVIQVTEAWALPQHLVRLGADILEKYGSIENYPGKLDTAHFALETRERYYWASPLIVPRGMSKRRRTIGDVVFKPTDPRAEGRFTGYLPKKSAS